MREKLTKIQPVLLWLVNLYFAEKFVRNGIRKFDVDDGFWVGAFERWGYPMWFMVFIGVMETLGGVAILIPKTRPYGAFTLAIVMAGALITRLIHGVSLGDAISISFFMIAMFYMTTYPDKKIEQ
jgi:uncharacterized membrane protein YphA (DoxX/SURF4 family)